MDYSYSGGGAFAAIDVSEVPLASVPYKISVVLDLPRDSYNQELGNFMVRMTVVNSTLDDFLNENSFPEFYEGTKVISPPTPVPPSGPVIGGLGWKRDGNNQGGLHRPSQKWPLTHNKKYIFDRLPGLVSSTKPAILPYKSKVLELIETVVFSPLYLIGYWEQKTVVPIQMMHWPISATAESKSVVVELDRTVNLNMACLLWSVEWTGLRYYMYYHWIFMFVIGTAFFWFIETVAMLLMAWYIFHAYKSHEEEENVDEEELSRVDYSHQDSRDGEQSGSENESLLNTDIEELSELSENPDVEEYAVENNEPGRMSSKELKLNTLLEHRAVRQESPQTEEAPYPQESNASSQKPQLNLLDSLGPDPGPLTPAATPGPWEEDEEEKVYPEQEMNFS
ncbi:hypothetical protein AWJ20_1288 [Sugiyamaella lignohabitans]|uniref:Seipin n=1 Tax=Sugiyamaella lignohabitans TaxID=796027 RepID=A0A167DKE8_9ASCO|nr:uncharacterized protein AWJ20_1288 [Sugiyamaella lignohabitans]ANB13010.1 hypothetical protein AWJ20_1288 [Sugiyamaella lignohabitans]